MMNMTNEQAGRGKNLINIAGGYASLITLAAKLPPDTLAKLREAHNNQVTDMCCNAHNEGLWCCIDILLFDPADYAPKRWQLGQDLLARYRVQLAEQ